MVRRFSENLFSNPAPTGRSGPTVKRGDTTYPHLVPPKTTLIRSLKSLVIRLLTRRKCPKPWVRSVFQVMFFSRMGDREDARDDTVAQREAGPFTAPLG